MNATSSGFFANFATHPTTGEVFAIDVVNNAPRTMRWNGSAFVSPTTSSPAVGPGGESLLPFAGVNASGFGYLNSAGVTSVLTGNTWSTLTITGPGARQLSGVTSTVDGQGQSFLFGGVNGATLFDDLWSFQGTTWTLITPTGSNRPPACFGAALAHDGFGGLVMVGGGAGTQIFDTVWRFAGGTWTQLASMSQTRMCGSLVFDRSRSQLLLAGGYGDVSPTSRDRLTDIWINSTSSGGLTGPWTLSAETLVNAPQGPPTSPGFCVSGFDGTRNEVVIADLLLAHVWLDKVASALVVAASPAPCVVPNLAIQGTMAPRFDPNAGSGASLTLPLGGAIPSGNGGAAMIVCGSVAAPDSPTGIPFGNSPCMTFLNPATTVTFGVVSTIPGGGYTVPVNMQQSTSLIGLIADYQAFGLDGSTLLASQVLRIVFGRV